MFNILLLLLQYLMLGFQINYILMKYSTHYNEQLGGNLVTEVKDMKHKLTLYNN